MAVKKSERRCFGKQCVELTSPDKILFPKGRISKAAMVDYYEKIAPYMLPHMKNRMLTMQRFPDGITGEGFYHKNIPDYFPAWIKRVGVERSDGHMVHYMVCTSVAALVYLANAGCLTPHLFLSKIDKMHYPDELIFDLDPSKKNDFATVKEIALVIKTLLEKLGLVPFVKLTGSRGVHVLVPLKRAHTYDEVKAFAQDIARIIVEQYPKKTTLELRKDKRAGKIFIDTLRNSFTATAVAPYAIRPLEGAPIAMPVYWDDLEDPQLKPTSYTIKNAFERLHEKGDAWKDVYKHAKSLTQAIKIIARYKR